MVEIREIRAFAPELVRQLDFVKGGNIFLRAGQGGRDCKRREGDEKTQHTFFITGS